MKKFLLTAAVLALGAASADARPRLFSRLRGQPCPAATAGTGCNQVPQGPTGTVQTTAFVKAAPVPTQAVSGPRFPLLSRVFGTVTGGGSCVGGNCGR